MIINVLMMVPVESLCPQYGWAYTFKVKIDKYDDSSFTEFKKPN